MVLDDGLEIRDVPGMGRGVFATRDFRKNEFVCEYKGELLTEEQAEARAESYDAQALEKNLDVIDAGCFMFWFEYDGKTYCLDACKDDGSKGRLVNHSIQFANLRPQVGAFAAKILLYATCKIVKGQQIFYDYGEVDSDIVKKFPWLKK